MKANSASALFSTVVNRDHQLSGCYCDANLWQSDIVVRDPEGRMTFFQIETEINASAELVWATMRDVERWPEWTPTVRSVRLRTPPPLAVGSRAVIRQPKLPLALWRVVELDDSHRSFTWVNSAPGVRVVAKHSVVPFGERSRITLSLRFEGPLAGILGIATRKLNSRYLTLEAQGLKSRVEGDHSGQVKLNELRGLNSNQRGT